MVGAADHLKPVLTAESIYVRISMSGLGEPSYDGPGKRTAGELGARLVQPFESKSLCEESLRSRIAVASPW